MSTKGDFWPESPKWPESVREIDRKVQAALQADIVSRPGDVVEALLHLAGRTVVNATNNDTQLQTLREQAHKRLDEWIERYRGWRDEESQPSVD